MDHAIMIDTGDLLRARAMKPRRQDELSGARASRAATLYHSAPITIAGIRAQGSGTSKELINGSPRQASEATRGSASGRLSKPCASCAAIDQAMDTQGTWSIAVCPCPIECGVGLVGQ